MSAREKKDPAQETAEKDSVIQNDTDQSLEMLLGGPNPLGGAGTSGGLTGGGSLGIDTLFGDRPGGAGSVIDWNTLTPGN